MLHGLQLMHHVVMPFSKQALIPATVYGVLHEAAIHITISFSEIWKF